MNKLLINRYIVLLIIFLFKFVYSNAQDEEPILVINTMGHSAMVNDLVFYNEGKTLISVANDKTIRLWDVASGKLERTLRAEIGAGQTGQLYCSAVSSDGKYFAVAGYPAEFGIRIFNMETGELDATLTGEKNFISDISFSPDGKWLAGAGSDNNIRLWNVAEFASKKSSCYVLEGHKANVGSIVFSPDSKILASASLDGTLRLWKIRNTGKASFLKEMAKHTDGVRCVCWASNGAFIASGGIDGKILLWNSEGDYLGLIANTGAPVLSLAFSESGNKLLAMNIKGTIYSIPDGNPLISFNEHNNSVLAACFWGDSIVATAGGNNNDIYIWNTETATVLKHLVGDGKSIWSLAFNDKLEIAFGKTGNFISNNNRGELEYTFDFFKLQTIKEIENESIYTRASEIFMNDTLREIDENILAVVNNLSEKIITENDKWLRCYTFSKEGNIIVGTDYSLKMYDKSGKLIRDFIGHNGHIWAVAVSQNGKILASGSDDQTIKLWNIYTGENLASLFVANDNEWVCWTGNYFVSSKNGQKYIGWHVNRGVDNVAEYFDLEVYRKKYFKPFIVKGTILLGSFEKAFKRYTENQYQLQSDD